MLSLSLSARRDIIWSNVVGHELLEKAHTTYKSPQKNQRARIELDVSVVAIIELFIITTMKLKCQGYYKTLTGLSVGSSARAVTSRVKEQVDDEPLQSKESNKSSAFRPYKIENGELPAVSSREELYVTVTKGSTDSHSR